ncbi:MAG: tRNA (uridine(34)/cytosine(34)/5-carboxymethylaminomethyluridine(34)-2'-O)-methyltransferase TrmL [Cellvibrionales bacterium]|jgi:tRNA (cytidine/uridine-2'-O-)-methyltransferase|nr:tRNA (uridine(34)/cytosine(34)/5-carboxymethylaminomethyluridine(34)-2'-O)-methyltransferase TrmL [Cellvibrionales bacterium]MBK8676063.1 tRNA (uridine(34)/cytosine(34)/5-carboxymethylaminomethyluridine(34)-2'-O)-methyltransferase TrmL [Cellvibrionales bacterium]TXH51396.1 MAG: tRNA (uridine(34)/cytosine(34)/5-carboxymethylaminomethyluridine(34)-2'-O)-methyltransferase TrmL [Cellvibrionales bacterium]HRG50390.1 tRNA (uridine(34)/cytosine(34)/5-carboxymethylaminomethyluridine(34)-2'-O)-methylt
MLHIVLYEPEIPPNTGNIMRLCANTGFSLHLIEPLGFTLDEKQLRRAGLDYRDSACTTTYRNWQQFIDTVQPSRIFALSTKGTRAYCDIGFQKNDAVVFGPETRGLPQAFRDNLPNDHILRLPMQPDSRSLNLSNAVAVVAYEAWRQWDFS